MCWFSEPDKSGKFRKRPYPHDEECTLYEEGVAKYSEKENWLSYSRAQEVRQSSAEPLGLGFVLSEEDCFVLLDIDFCLSPTNMEMAKEAMDLVENATSYTEISPSGEGIHVLLKGDIQRQGWTKIDESLRIEIYDNFFITVTQNHVKGTPRSVERNQKFLNQLFQNHHISWPDPKFTSFWPETP